jgi:diguanylate cyclase (GGDEF)-like protein/PAS domain S-box-containing protein
MGVAVSVPRRVASAEDRLVLDGFEGLPAAMVELDSAGRVRRATRAALALLGRDEDDLLGEEFASFALPEMRDALEARLEAQRRGHRLARPFDAWLTLDGTGTRRVRITGAALRGAGGRALVLSLEDRTAQAAGDGPFRALVQSAPTAILSADDEGRITLVNPAAEAMFGYAAHDLLGRPVEILVPERFRRGHRGLRAGYSENPQTRPLAGGGTLWARRKDGSELPVEISLAPSPTPDGTVVQIVLVDVTERLRAQAELERRAAQQAAIAQLGKRALEGATAHDLMAEAARLVAGALGEELVGVAECGAWGEEMLLRAGVGWPAEMLGKARLGGRGSLVGAALRAEGPVVCDDLAASAEYAGALLDPERGAASAAAVAIGARGRPFGVLVVHSDRSAAFGDDDVHFLEAAANILADAIARRLVEERTRHAALHDPLTGLPNRSLLLERARHWQRLADRGRGGLAAVLFLDLDHFKLVNDSLGHEAGDELLRQVATRLRAAVRPMDTVARFGGDEFVIFLEDLEDRDGVLGVVTRVQDAFAEPFTLGTASHGATTSIGVAICEEGAEADALLRNADAALYRAKDRGRARYELFDRGLHKALVRRLRLGAELRSAVRRGDVHVHFQPVVELGTGRVATFEALARWRRRGEPIHPAEFIPIAEETGLVVALGTAVLERAAAQAASWQRRFGGSDPVGVSVNLSPRQLAEGDVVGLVGRVLRETGLEPARLALEITETAIMRDVEAAIARIRALRGLGVRIVLDDFGTGYSSLSHLKRLPIDTVKVDKLFVDAIARDAGSRAIVAAVLSMAEGFGATVVAEGVEDREQLRHLADVGCHYGQGHLFARDLTPAEADVLLYAQRRAPRALGAPR